MKHLTFCALLLTGLSTLGTAQYNLTVEASPATVVPNATTYKFYVNFDDANDQISAVFGNDEKPLEVNVPEGAFNAATNTSWNASGINPTFVSIFPDLADDSFATLGLAGPASTSGIDGAADPQLAEDATQPITPFFLTDGATSLLSNSIIGASWFTINTAQNAFAGDDLRVLVMQVTTTGDISGTLNYQVFNQFDPSSESDTEAIQVSVDFDGSGVFYPEGGPVEGCDDTEACNYNPNATIDDGSCEYIAEGACDCDGNVLDAVGVCGGDCTEDADSNGVCDGSEVYGCTQPLACNYDPAANIDDGSCIGFPDFYCDCESTIPDADNDGVCDVDEVDGCQDVQACNFDPSATEDDGTCEYCSCAESAYTLAVESYPAYQPGLTTYRFYVNMLDSTDQLSAVYAEEGEPMVISVPEGAWNSPNAASWNASGINPSSLMAFPDLVDDSFATIGLDGPAGPLGSEYQDPLLVGGVETLQNLFTIDGDTGFVEDAFPGLSWSVLNTAANSLPDANNQVLVMQITTSGNVSGTLNYQVFPRGDTDDVIYVTATFDGVGAFGQANVCGCMSPIACNYNPDATIDDGTCDLESCVGCTDETACNYDETATLSNNELCEYSEAGLNCDGTCVDSNANGTCDSEEIAGCTDPDGCNYNENATLDDGSCEGPVLEYQDCDGNCLNDADGDGVCDEEEIEGCTTEGACNYDIYATDDDGTCEYDTCAGCTEEGACNYDEDATINDNSCEYDSCAGCTDAEACNYDATATIDDDSCEYDTCAGCTEEGACNYDAAATIDDGSCEYDSCAGCTDETACNYDETATISDADACDFPGDACDDDDDTTINDAYNDDCECVGIVDGIAEATLDFGMFPNPTTGEVTLSMVGFHTGVTIQVMDASGRAVWTQQNLVLQGNKVLDLSGLSSGTYNVMLSDERGVSVKRLAIQR